MPKQSQTLDDIFNEVEAERREAAREPTEAERAVIEAKRREEFDRGVRLGWHDSEGNPIGEADEDDEEESE